VDSGPWPVVRWLVGGGCRCFGAIVGVGPGISGV
jgi:hypothetical protein